MKITDIRTFIAGNPWKNWMFVRVDTDDGIHGIGEGTFNGFAKATEAALLELKQLAVGRNPFDTEALSLILLRDFYTDGGHIQRGAVAAIEMACLDIKAKSLGVPVYQLLGGRVRERIPVYANGWYRCPRDPEAVAQAAIKTVADGYRALKFDPFGEAYLSLSKHELDLSLKIVQNVRQAVGDQIELMVEGHCRFTVGQAIEIGRRLEPFDIEWFEEPVPHHGIADVVAVARQVPVRIATGESFHTRRQFAELISESVVAVYQPEIMALGGLSQARHVCAMVESVSGLVAPHNAQGPVSTAACLQLAACCNNYLVLEYFDQYNVAWEKDLVTWSPSLNQDGTMDIPHRPGLGLDLNLEEIAKHPYHDGNYLPLFGKDWFKREGRNRGK